MSARNPYPKARVTKDMSTHSQRAANYARTHPVTTPTPPLEVDWSFIEEETRETFADQVNHYQAVSTPWRDALAAREFDRMAYELDRTGAHGTEPAQLHTKEPR